MQFMQFIYQNRVHCGHLETYLKNATKWEAKETEENNENEEESQEWIDFQNIQKLYNLAECGNKSGDAQGKVKRSVNPASGKGQKGIVICPLQFSFFQLISGKRKQPASTKREMEFLELYTSKGMMARIGVGHQAQDFLKSCTFGGLECTIDNK